MDWIIDVTCKDRSYGARPLRRAIQRYVEDPLSEELIRGNLGDGEVEVYMEAGQISYRPARGTGRRAKAQLVARSQRSRVQLRRSRRPGTCL